MHDIKIIHKFTYNTTELSCYCKRPLLTFLSVVSVGVQKTAIGLADLLKFFYF